MTCRLFYVGTTRAKSTLTLTWAGRRFGQVGQQPSSFLAPIAQRLQQPSPQWRQLH